jgi:2-methylcitrate dehydratase
MTGPSPVYEGVGGYFKAVTRKPFTLPTMGGRDGGNEHPFKIMECSIKHFPLGQYSQTVVEAALQLRERIGNPQDIAEIRVETVSTAVRLMADDPQKWEPETRESADHSMPYTVAIAFLHGEVGEEHFEDRYLHDPDVRALTRLVKVKESDEANRRMPVAMLCQMTVVMRSGATHDAAVEYHRGHYMNPMSEAEVERKFRRLAGGVLPDAKVDRLLERLWTLDAAEDVGEVVRMTIAG